MIEIPLTDPKPDFQEFDAIHSSEDSNCSVIDYKEKYGTKIALLGGVDIDKMTRAVLIE